MNKKGFQNKLLVQTDLMYGKAFDIVRSLEVAAQNLQYLRSTSRTPRNDICQHDINKMHARNTFKKNTCKGRVLSECYRYHIYNINSLKDSVDLLKVEVKLGGS